jgi:hypothetical protein
VPSSFGLAKIASRWHGRGPHGPKLLNGCLLMAASRLGYKLERQPPRYVDKIGRDDANAWLNICGWPRDDGRRPGR